MNSSIYISDRTWEQVKEEFGADATPTKVFRRMWEERSNVPQNIPHQDMIPEGTEKLEGFTILESLIVSHIDRTLNDLQPMYEEDVKELIDDAMTAHVRQSHDY